MKRLTRIQQIIFLSLLMMSSVSHAGEWTRIDDKTISFTGSIEKDEFLRFQKVYKATDEKIILNSPGGRMDAALDIGKVLIKNKKLTAVVRGICASSCANYLFIASQNKVIDHGVVGFHGNWKAMLYKNNLEKEAAKLSPEEGAKLLAFHKQRLQDETDLFAEAGISQELFDKTQKENDDGIYDIYLPGPDVFKKSGIKNVKGNQDLSLTKGFKVLYDNGLQDNSSEDLKSVFMSEYWSAPEKRKLEIREVLKYLNNQYPPQEQGASSAPSATVR